MNKKTLIFIISGILALMCITVAAVHLFNEKTNTTPYEKISQKGYTGTEDDLLKSLSDEEKDSPKEGSQTLSAYDLATQNGYNGSENDWLEALTGEKNLADKYTDDSSVYDLAVGTGYSGSLEDWIESLKKPSDKNTNNKKPSATDNVSNSGSDNETPEQSEFTVVFKNYDGEELKTEVVKKGEAATPPATPTKDGYTFIGWDRTFNSVESNMTVNAMFEKIIKPTIIVDRVASFAGEKKVAVNVAVKNNPGIASLNLNVTFDSALEFKKVEYNRAIGGNSMKPGSEESPVKLVWVSPFEDVTGDWVFATLYFDVTEDAKGDLPIYITYYTEDIYNMKEENVYFDVVNGAIAITK